MEIRVWANDGEGRERRIKFKKNSYSDSFILPYPLKEVLKFKGVTPRRPRQYPG
jgi:hypothetical protein